MDALANPNETGNNGTVSGFNKLRSWIVGLSAVLVLLPALINAGIDIRNALLNIPVTEAEIINDKLFRQYFGKTPLLLKTIPIKKEVATIYMELQVFSEGDILVKYGDHSHWFQFPLTKIAAENNIISSAFASEEERYDYPDTYIQRDTMKNGKIQREYYYPGRNYKRLCEIDTITGRWACSSEYGQFNGSIPNDVSEPVKVNQDPAVDLTQLVNCWRHQPNGLVICKKSFLTCGHGWNEGTPPSNNNCGE